MLLAMALMLISAQCRKPDNNNNNNNNSNNNGNSGNPEYSATPYDFSKDNLALFPSMPKNPNNPVTQEGVQLGRMLFYDPILSADSSQSCSSCHKQANGFASDAAFQVGVHGTIGTRSSMPLNNLAWENIGFFWDGRSKTIEDQVTHPVENPDEMAENWDHVVMKLKNSKTYPALFRKAFQDGQVSKDNAAKALAQFLRTLISSHSKFDIDRKDFTPSEERGFVLFGRNPQFDDTRELTTHGADCVHCHNAAQNFQDYTSIGTFRNNGLDSVASVNDFKDKGYGTISGNPDDNGKFKVPSLRNVEFSAPYMHDGRFKTLSEVIDHYNAGGKPSPNCDISMARNQFAGEGGKLFLDDQDKTDLINFLKTLSDTTFIHDPRYSNPFKK
jgi:cytochrome c peroxidase